MFATLAAIWIAFRPSRTFDVVFIVWISKGVKKIAEFTALRTLGHTADGASPGCDIDEFTVELLAGVPASLQVPPSSSCLSLCAIFNVQITSQVNLFIAATLKGLNPAERFEFSYYVLIEFIKMMQRFWTLKFECHVSVVFCRVFLKGEMWIESWYQDHFAQKDFTMIFGAHISIAEDIKNQLYRFWKIQI